VHPAMGADSGPVSPAAENSVSPTALPPSGNGMLAEAPANGLSTPSAAASGSASVPPPAAMPRVPTQPIPAGRAPVSGGPSGAQTQALPTSHAQNQTPLPPRSRTGHVTEPGLATRPMTPSAQAPPTGDAASTAAPVGGAATSASGAASVSATAPVFAPTAGKSPAGPTYVPGPSTAAEAAPLGGEFGPPRPLEVGDNPGPRAVIENVQVTTYGIKATVEVHLAVGDRMAVGNATGPSLDGYLLRLCAMATADAIDDMLAHAEHADGPARCHVHHAAVVPFG